jgi:prepilin-type N-terminal cleavage/methylation domain-containing protein
MRRRRGITLIEVLVAIFIMAIGLLAILTLFPLGALRMGQALSDDRAAAAANAGANIGDAFGLRADPAYYSTNPTAPANWFVTPPPPPAPYTPFPPAAVNGSGYPVYVDPWGAVANGNPAPPVGQTANSPGIPRAVPAGLPGQYNPASPNYSLSQMAARYFTLPDDMTFATNGLPDTSTGVIQRGGRYTWAYLLHRSPPAAPNSPVDLTVVVYSGRATAVPGGENTFGAAGNQSDTAVSLSWAAGQPTPNVRRGSWVLDTTADSVQGVLIDVHGTFYRVVAVTQPTANTMILELQTPLGKPIPAGTGQVTVLDNVIEVFSRWTDPPLPSRLWEFRNDQP